MKHAAVLISFAALAGTIAPPILFFFDRLDLANVKLWMFASTVAWFVATPIWMEREGRS